MDPVENLPTSPPDSDLSPPSDPEFMITPNGRFIFFSQPFSNLFASGLGSGLFALGTMAWPAEAGRGSFFMRNMIREALTRLALVASEHRDDGEALQALQPTQPLAQRILDSFPIVVGAEFVSLQLIHHWHAELARHIQRELDIRGISVLDWLQSLGNPWNNIGKIFFHLAENQDDPEHPFAFMATFAHKASSGNEVCHYPLATALSIYANDHRALVSLLEPLQKAAQHGSFVKSLIETRSIYSPMAWDAARTYAFLQETGYLEEAGIVVRMVNLWKKHPPRVQVAITADLEQPNDQHDSPPSTCTIHSLLHFSVAASLGGRHLSQEELDDLLAQEGGLIRFHGEWITIDQEKIRFLLDRWQQAARMMNRLGISLVQGLRLLIHGPSDKLPYLPDPDPDHSSILPGARLQEALNSLSSTERGDANSFPPVPQSIQSLLRPYQKDGVLFLERLTSRGFGACLADDMGLGKTLQAIAWLIPVIQQNSTGIPPLVITPTSLLTNWKHELKRFAPNLVPRVLHPSACSVPASLPPSPQRFFSGYDVVLTSYGMATNTEWLADLQFPAIILDEAQAVKNSQSRRSQAIRKLQSPRRVALSGTPIETSPTELHSLMDFLNPGLLGSKKAFDNFVRNAHGNFSVLKKLARPFILRRMKTDRTLVPDLPDKTEKPVYCSLTPVQAALYHAEVQRLRSVIEEPDPAKRLTLILPFLARFKQICNHPDQYRGTGPFTTESSGKFMQLRQLAQQIARQQSKMLLFTQFRSIIAPLHDLLAHVFHRSGLILHGGVPVPERGRLVQLFQQENGPPFMILSLRAAGTGLTLTQASHVVHFDRWWNPAVENQATDRAFRIGQHKNVLVHPFICLGTIEERIDDLLRKRQQMADSVLGEGLETILFRMPPDELLNLFTSPFPA